MTPQQETELRRLLADARHGEPVPVDVAARLDRVLEQLAQDEPPGSAPRTPEPRPVELAARRRRQGATMLVAAAAVLVAGFGISQVVRDDPAAERAGSSSAADEAPAATGTELLEAAPTADAAPGDAAESGPAASAPPARLTRATFAERVVTLQRRPGVEVSEGQVVPPSALTGFEGFMCPAHDWGTGRLVPALYGVTPAVLAYRPPAGDTQVVELLQCGSGRVLRSTVLPVR